MKYFTGDKQEITVSVIGDGIPIIFISGYSGNQYSWAVQNEYFSSKGYQCIHIDKRGHGTNREILTGLSISRLAVDIKEAIDFLKLNDFHIVSHSMGSLIALEYLRLFGENQVNSLTIMDCSPKPINTGEWHLGLKGLHWDNIQNISQGIPYNKLSHKKIDLEILRKLNYGQYQFDFIKTLPLVFDFMTRDYLDLLSAINSPVLFIGTDSSPLFSKDLTLYFDATVKNGKSYLMKNCGHLPYAESPDETNKLLHEFIATNCT